MVYTPDYVGIKYPNGDVPAKKCVCKDLVILAYRKLGIEFADRSTLRYESEFFFVSQFKKMGF